MMRSSTRLFEIKSLYIDDYGVFFGDFCLRRQIVQLFSLLGAYSVIPAEIKKMGCRTNARYFSSSS